MEDLDSLDPIATKELETLQMECGLVSSIVVATLKELGFDVWPGQSRAADIIAEAEGLQNKKEREEKIRYASSIADKESERRRLSTLKLLRLSDWSSSLGISITDMVKCLVAVLSKRYSHQAKRYGGLGRRLPECLVYAYCRDILIENLEAGHLEDLSEIQQSSEADRKAFAREGDYELSDLTGYLRWVQKQRELYNQSNKVKRRYRTENGVL